MSDIDDIQIHTDELLKFFRDNPHLIPPSPPGRPEIPEGFPQNFVEALAYEGVCALPLKANNGSWSWYPMADGGRFSRISDECLGDGPRFNTFEEAVVWARKACGAKAN